MKDGVNLALMVVYLLENSAISGWRGLMNVLDGLKFRLWHSLSSLGRVTQSKNVPWQLKLEISANVLKSRHLRLCRRCVGKTAMTSVSAVASLRAVQHMRIHIL